MDWTHSYYEDAGNWQIGVDTSITWLKDTDYTWTGVEVKSPALAPNKMHWKAVEQVCSLITKNYVVNVNQTCGLHIHVSTD